MVEKNFNLIKTSSRAARPFFSIGSSQKIYAARFTEAADKEKGKQSKAFVGFSVTRSGNLVPFGCFGRALVIFFELVNVGHFLCKSLIKGAFRLGRKRGRKRRVKRRGNQGKSYYVA